MSNHSIVHSLNLSTIKKMERCPPTVQATPPIEDNPSFTQHILWAPKKKRLHRRVISSELPSSARAHSHSKIRKRLIYPSLEDDDRKDEEEEKRHLLECKQDSYNEEKHSLRTPDCAGNKRNDVHLKLSKPTDARAQLLKTNHKGRNVDPQRIKRKLALSSFR